MPDYIVTLQPAPVLPAVVLQPAPGLSTVLAVQQGPSGPAGSTKTTYVAASGVSGHRVVLADADGLAAHASADNAAHLGAVVGVTLGAASAAGYTTVQSSGVIEHSGWTWAPDAPVFLGLDGQLVQTPDLAAVFSQVVGWARSPTRVLLNLQPPLSF